jgi:hypothetical protein
MAEQNTSETNFFRDVNWMLTWRVGVFLVLVWIGWSAAKIASAVDTNAQRISVQDVRWVNQTPAE